MSHRRGVSVTSTSSSIPILINPTLSAQARNAPEVRGPILKYPYPLHFLVLLDLVYTIRHAYNHTTPAFFRVLLGSRVSIVGGLVGTSARWRSRGGLVALISCLTIGSCIWEGCAAQLYRGKGEHLAPERRSHGLVGDAHTLFLILTSCIAISEFLIYILCLRLSPPSHRVHPLSIRNPPSTVQSPTAFSFSFDADNDDDLRFFTTSTPRRNRYASRPISHNDIFTHPSAENEGEDQVGFTDEEDFEEDSASSISESSIIDLPPPLSPSRIHPPTSLSMPRALNLAALDGSPILGPLVRRTRSARFLVGSFGRRETLGREEEGRMGREGRERAASAAAGPSEGDGYGTFGG